MPDGASAVATPAAASDLRQTVRGMGGGVLWSYVSMAVTGVTAPFLVAFGLRVLGPAAYGTFALLNALTLLFLVLDFGLSLGVVRATAHRLASAEPDSRRRDELDVHTAHQVYVTIGLGLMGLGVAGCATYGILTGHAATASTAGLLFAAMAVNLGFAAFQGLATGYRRFDVIATATITSTIVMTGIVVGLLGAIGLPALGLGQLASALVMRIVLSRWARRDAPWFRWRYRFPRWTRVRRVLTLAGPLVVISAGSQLTTTFNLYLIAVVANPAAVGLYRAAFALPAQAVQVLYRGYDVVFPTLVGVDNRVGQERLNALLTRVASYIAGLGFGILFVARAPVTALLTGRDSPRTATILALFCVFWLVNVPIHGVSLVLIARSEQRRFLFFSSAEWALGTVLTVVLTLRYGAVGAAAAAVISIVVSNGVILPVLIGRAFRTSVSRVTYLDGYARGAVGFATASVAAALVPQHAGDLSALAILCAVSVALAAPVGYLVVGREARALVSGAVRRRVRQHATLTEAET